MHINFKWGTYASIVALLLAFIISIILGQAGFSAAILRGLFFAVLFFALGTGAQTLINTFMPELLFPESHDVAANIFGDESPDSQSGSRINITLGDGADAALPENDGGDNGEVGNIADLVSGAVDPAAEARKNKALDEFNKNSYNGSAEDSATSLPGFADTDFATTGFAATDFAATDFAATGSADAGSAVPAATEEGGGFSMNFDNFALGGGLETFGDSFSLPDNAGAREEEVLPERKVTGNKPMALEGDFNPKDIAAGIRTVLETDKRG